MPLWPVRFFCTVPSRHTCKPRPPQPVTSSLREFVTGFRPLCLSTFDFRFSPFDLGATAHPRARARRARLSKLSRRKAA